MSNIAFDFLTESFLFNESSSKYSIRTLEQLENEINRYKKYIIDHVQEINAEICKEYNFIQPLSMNHRLPGKDELIQGCLFLDTYLIDDPIFSYNITQIKMGDIERVSMGMDRYSEDEIKQELSSFAEYMKSLTSGVNIENGYIKFYPFSLWVHSVFNPVIRIPDLSIEDIPKNVYEWFYKNIEVLNLEENRTNPNLKLSNRIVLKFKEDYGDSAYIAHYQVLIPEKIEGNHLIGRFDGNHIPNELEYSAWVNQEVIKAIKRKLEFFVFRDSVCNRFNSPVCLYNEFQRNFYTTVFNSSKKEHMYKLGFDLNIPGLSNIDFDKAMEIRKKAHWSFVELQQKIKEDSNQLFAITDEKIYEEMIRHIENDYLEGIKSTNTLLESMKKLLSINNLVNLGFFVESYFTGNLSHFTTGLSIINGLYNVYDITKSQLSNPMYFLKKMIK